MGGGVILSYSDMQERNMNIEFRTIPKAYS